jgi:hypothetical protein
MDFQQRKVILDALRIGRPLTEAVSDADVTIEAFDRELRDVAHEAASGAVRLSVTVSERMRWADAVNAALQRHGYG